MKKNVVMVVLAFLLSIILSGCFIPYEPSEPEDNPDVWCPVEITSINSIEYYTYITVYGVLKNVSDKPIKWIWLTVKVEDNYNSGQTTLGLGFDGDGLLPEQSTDFSVDINFMSLESSYEYGWRVDEVGFTDGTKWEAE